MHSDILKINNLSIFTADIKEKSDLVIGVPHHTPSGTYTMPCETHVYGDENTGYIGSYISKQLGCSLLCACNYFIDPNKNYKYNYSDYYQALQKCNPKYLVEIHGHGIEHGGDDVEISCGSKKEENRARTLKYEIEKLIDMEANKNIDNKDLVELKKIKINADFDKIFLKATKSSTIVDDRWLSYHIELPLILRINSENEYLPNKGLEFTKILCKAIKNICN